MSTHNMFLWRNKKRLSQNSYIILLLNKSNVLFLSKRRAETWQGSHVSRHTCYISHCKIKSHRIWPIWKAIPIKNSNLTEFSDRFTTSFMKK